MFDSLTIARQLTEAGIERAQADVLADAIRQAAEHGEHRGASMNHIERLPEVGRRREATPDERSESQGIISAADAMRLPDPEPVLRQVVGGADGAVVCSVGEPAILTGPGGMGKSSLALAWACAGAEAAAEAEAVIAAAMTEARAAAEAVAEAEAEAEFAGEVIEGAIAEAEAEYAVAAEAVTADVDDIGAAAVWLPPESAAALEHAAQAAVEAAADAAGIVDVEGAAEYAAEAAAEAEALTVAPTSWRVACGLAVRPGPVLLVSYEDQPARIASRLRAMEVPGAVLKRRHIVVDPEPLWKPTDRIAGGACCTAAFTALQKRLNALRPSLVVLDPISAAAGGLNLNDGGAARYAMRSLAKLSATLGSGILIVAHDTKTARSAAKAGTLPGAGAVGGSAQWFDAVRSVLYLHRGSEENSAIDRTLTALKVNNGVDGWVVPLAKDNSDEGVFRGFCLTEDTRTADTLTSDESCPDVPPSLAEDDIPF